MQNPKHSAIDILSRRDNSVSEMRKKLSKKGISEEEIDQTILWLQEKELLDDRQFALKKAESIMRTKAVGPRYIINKLREAGIDGDQAEAVVDNLALQHEWQERSKKAIEQWKRAHPKHKDDTVRQKRFLASRGFDMIDL